MVKTTEPVGTAIDGEGVTVAVLVTTWPKTDRLGPTLTVAPPATRRGVWVVAPLERLKGPLGWNVPGTVCVPAGGGVDDSTALPLESSALVAIAVVWPRPSLAVKVTLPNGVVVGEVTVAV